MDTIFQTFHRAQYSYSGPSLASTLSPIPPPHDPSLLRRFHADFNVFSITDDIRRYLKNPQSTSLSKPEITAWTDIYTAYWKAIGEILRAENHHDGDGGGALKVYEAWKEVTNLLIRGYGGPAGFGAWTMPVLYTAGKWLRVFAIRADEEQAGKVENNGTVMKMEVNNEDDVMSGGGHEKHERLEDAARVINRMFTLCISDRAPLEESRKWGLYYTTNLLFKTYFKLNSISLSKNILRALQASKTDMPPQSAFPKSHIAEASLTSAFQLNLRTAITNKEYVPLPAWVGPSPFPAPHHGWAPGWATNQNAKQTDSS
ncbi:MAG: hypothetical protein Q9220_005216 [cf. Caloplaca sp. 1 TL-2023]